jgi:hypothetical protein
MPSTANNASITPESSRKLTRDARIGAESDVIFKNWLCGRLLLQMALVVIPLAGGAATLLWRQFGGYCDCKNPDPEQKTFSYGWYAYVCSKCGGYWNETAAAGDTKAAAGGPAAGDGKKGATADQAALDNRSRQLNPQDAVYQRIHQSSRDNRSRQMNPADVRFAGAGAGAGGAGAAGAGSAGAAGARR